MDMISLKGKQISSKKVAEYQSQELWILMVNRKYLWFFRNNKEGAKSERKLAFRA
jgi:hypothetical protein